MGEDIDFQDLELLVVDMHFFLLSSMFFSAAADCYGANRTTFFGCFDYEKHGYHCKCDMCATDHPVGHCGQAQCAVHYESSVVDMDNGLCCDSLSGGECVGQKDGKAPYFNEVYGFPDHIQGHIIVEGVLPYLNGPMAWSTTNASGAYAFTWNPASGETDIDCPAIPNDMKIDATKVKPINLNKHNTELPDSCGLGCNPHEVEKTGRDPCHGGSRDDIPIKMSCFSGGDEWLRGGLGLCAYPCQLRADNGSFCTWVDPDVCSVWCDPRNSTSRSLGDVHAIIVTRSTAMKTIVV